MPGSRPVHSGGTGPAASLARMNDETTTAHRSFGFRSLLAVGVAGVVLGGAVGTAVTLVADDGHGPGPGPGGHPAPMGVPGGPPR